MFEQSLYGQDPGEKVETHEGDLFYNYEIKPWTITPKVYKILGLSAVINILALFIVAQTSLLTMKGCDSPLVNRVCQVMDTVYISSLLFGTEREYVDAAYDKTDLSNADITFVDVSNETGPLEYPTSFRDMNTGQDVAMFPSNQMAGFMGDPGIVPSMPMIQPDPQNNLLNTAPVTPQTNPNAVIGDVPTSPLGTNPTLTSPSTKNVGRMRMPKMPNASPNKLPNLEANTVASSNTSQTPNANTVVEEAKPDQYGVYINKRPMKDLAKDAIEKIDANAVSLDKPFKVSIAGTLGLGKDGKTIILKDPKIVRSKDDPKNDPEMEKLAQNAIIAVGDAGWLGYLDKLRAKNVVITVEQNDVELVASLRADQPSENDAKVAASGLNSLLSIATPLAKGDDQTFLSRAQTAADGKTFVLNFRIPKKDVQDMILRKLAELKANEGKPNGSAQVGPNDNTAAK